MEKSYVKNWYKTAQTVLDYDEVDEYGSPVATDVEQMMADNNLEEDEERIVQFEGAEQEDQTETEVLDQERQDEQFDLDVDSPWEPPDMDEEAPDTGNKTETLKYAIENRRVLEIIYSPAGRRNREINFGKSIKRVIEPHDMFQAGNGNVVVTTWDRSVGKIRAFIVDRIMNIIFREHAPRNPFKQRQRVLPSYERGKTMANKSDMLTKVLSKESNDKTKGFNLNKKKNVGIGETPEDRIQREKDRAKQLGEQRQRAEESEEKYRSENPEWKNKGDDVHVPSSTDAPNSLFKAREEAKERGRNLIQKRKREKENEERYQQEQNPKQSSANHSLVKIASELENKKLSKSAAVVKEINNILNQIKESQYVGFMGQALRNRRCWDNCYRNKRTSKPGTSAQEVWFECWDEYLASMKDSKKWDKYASVNDLARNRKWDKKFTEEVGRKMKNGMNVPEAVYDILNKEADRYIDTIIEQAGKLTELAVALNNNGEKELGKKIAAASNEVLKEAQFGGGWEGAWNKVRRYNPFSSKSRAKGLGGDISTRLKRLTQQVLQMSNKFNTIIQQSRQAGQEEVGYQQQQQPPPQQPLAKNIEINIKTAQPVDPAFAQGANDFTIQLRDEFATFLENVRNEASSMGQMSTQSTDQASKQRASQAAQRMMDFVQKANPFEQAFNKRQEMITQADALVTEMQSFANDINAIQMGTYDAGAEIEGDPREKFDINQDNMVLPDEAAASGEDDNQSGTLEIPEVIDEQGIDEQGIDEQGIDEQGIEAPPTGNVGGLSQAIKGDKQAQRYFAAFQADKTTRKGIAYLMNLYQQHNIPFTPENWKSVGQLVNWNPKPSVYGKSLLRNILNKNKRILIN